MGAVFRLRLRAMVGRGWVWLESPARMEIPRAAGENAALRNDAGLVWHSYVQTAPLADI